MKYSEVNLLFIFNLNADPKTPQKESKKRDLGLIIVRGPNVKFT